MHDCAYRQEIVSGQGSHEFSKNLTRETLIYPGEIYYIRVSAQNEAGTSSAEISQRFMIVPSVQSPMSTTKDRLRVAQGDNYVHVWEGDSEHNADGRLRVTVFGLDIHNPSEDLRILLYVQGQEQSERLDFESPRIDGSRLAFIVTLPILQSRVEQASTLVMIEFSSARSPESVASLYVEYFLYPQPIILMVLPTGAPISGGVSVILHVKEFVGDETRSGASLPNFADSLLPGVRTRIAVTCNDSALSTWVLASSAEIPSSVTADGMEPYRVYELSFVLPPSPCGPERVNFLVDLENDGLHGCALSNCSSNWRPKMQGLELFQFRNPGIMEVTPSSGMINRGNEKIIITITLENVGDVSGLSDVGVSLGGNNCTIFSLPSEVGSSETLLIQIKVVAPELPRGDAGLLDLTISSSTFGVFTVPWEFLAPPVPAIVPNSIRVNDENRDDFWFKQVGEFDDGATWSFEIEISALSEKYDTGFDQLMVNVDDYRDRVKVVSLIRQGPNVYLKFDLNVGDLPVGRYNLTLDVIKNEQVQWRLTFPEHIKIVDMSIPTAADGAIVPNEGPASGGTIVFVGIVGARPIIDATASFAFKVRQENKYEETVGEIVAGPLSLSAWGQGASYLDFLHKTSQQGSAQLANAYETVYRRVRSVIASDDDGAVLAVRTNPSSMSGKATGVIVAAESAEITFDFYLVATPSSEAIVVSATTAQGSASGPMEGAYIIVIVLSNFVITNYLHELSISFGAQIGQVVMLEFSNSKQGTKLRALVPPGVPGTVLVEVRHDKHPQNAATFEFQYIDTQTFAVERVHPFQIYNDGGQMVEVDILRLPLGIDITEFSIEMWNVDSSMQALGASMQPAMIQHLPAAKNGDSRTKIHFMSKELQDNDSANIRVDILIRGKAISFALEYKNLPDGPPHIVDLHPSTVTCTGGNQRVSMVLHNLRMVTRASSLHISVQGRTLNTEIRVQSTMSETFVSFEIPHLPDHKGGSSVHLSVWTDDLGVNMAANASFECLDTKKASLGYILPSFGDAGRNVSVKLGLNRFIGANYSNVRLFDNRY